MSELIIKRTSTLADFENHLRASNLGQSQLAVPNSLKEAGALGCSLAFAQFLLTWSRASLAPTINTFLEPEDTENHVRFTERAHGFAAAYFASCARSDRGKGPDIRRSLLLAARPRIMAMHHSELGETGRGTEIEFIFVEGATHEFHGALYAKAPTSAEIADREMHGRLIRGRNDLNRFLERCFRHLGVNERFNDYLFSSETPFGSLLAEAFRNTAEHAYCQANGDRLKKNMRCVRIARTQTSRDWLEAFQTGSELSREAGKRYFSALAGSSSQKIRKNVQLLEISIFDSGPGFSESMRASGRFPESPDKALIDECFRKHHSAKSQSNSGVGIFRILSAVHTLGGFVRVRTSTAEAFYAATSGFSPDMNPEDYVDGGLSRVEGTLLTIGIPIAF